MVSYISIKGQTTLKQAAAEECLKQRYDFRLDAISKEEEDLFQGTNLSQLDMVKFEYTMNNQTTEQTTKLA